MPIAARNYIARLEALCGIGVDIISTGPERNQTIVLKHPFDQ
jgi:adenylosuccinate synthase